MSDEEEMPNCEVDQCPNRASVGLGTPSKWLCLEHFNEEMSRIGRMVKRVNQL